jgi:uncharacterized alpha-E superfamily protein
MLSKVAERVYWTARYLERVESTARLVSIYDKLLFDLPRNVKLSWYNLIIINSLEQDFRQRYTVWDENNIVRFLIGDDSNPVSVVSSLQAIRENMRTTRDVLLQETWELTNELSMYVSSNLQQGVTRSQRHDFLENIIKGCQQINGLLYGNMPQDAVWDFLRLGRNLERADMTSRNLDAGIAAALEMENDDGIMNSDQIIWGGVLRALNADQSYRRSTRKAVRGKTVVPYLLENKELQRSIVHCLNGLIESSQRLPRSAPLVAELERIRQATQTERPYQALDYSFREYLNELQIKLAGVHTLISHTWFPHFEDVEETIQESA